MNIYQINKWIKEIERNTGDPEVAHITEDGLYIAFIEHVAECAPKDLAKLARRVLKAQEIDYPHWFA